MLKKGNDVRLEKKRANVKGEQGRKKMTRKRTQVEGGVERMSVLCCNM